MDSQDVLRGSNLLPRLGRHGPRSKTGCITCRTRKVKCDETPGTCGRCLKAQITCEWDQSPRSRRSTAESRKKTSVGRDQTVHAGSSPLVDIVSGPVISNTALESPVSHLSPISSIRGQVTSPYALFGEDGALLSPEDLESFEYIPRSFMVLRFGKPWQWSMLSYVHSTIAPRETGVMRAFIAVASMELRSRELERSADMSLSPQSVDKAHIFKRNASNSLHLAMQDLSELLNRIASDPNNMETLETLFSMWFLILHFGIYDADLVDSSYMHLEGIRSFIAQYFREGSDHRILKLPLASKQLLVYISYLDVMLALGGMNGGQLTLDLIAAPESSPVCYDRLFEEARTCVPQLWGFKYPVEELVDDVENYRPLKFLYKCQKLKLQTWHLGVASKNGHDVQIRMRNLWTKLKRLEEEYFDVILLAKQVPNTGGRRMIWTVYHATLDYHAVVVLYSCVDGADAVPSWLDKSLTELLAIAHKALNEDPEHVYRYAWALRMALLKVKDSIHREWLQTQVNKASLLLSNLGIPARSPEGMSVSDVLFAEHGLTHFGVV